MNLQKSLIFAQCLKQHGKDSETVFQIEYLLLRKLGQKNVKIQMSLTNNTCQQQDKMTSVAFQLNQRFFQYMQPREMDKYSDLLRQVQQFRSQLMGNSLWRIIHRENLLDGKKRWICLLHGDGLSLQVEKARYMK